MKTIINGIKSTYFQFVNFVQDLETIWFVTIWFALLALTLICIVKFFKKYDGTQKQFVKLGTLFMAILFFACLLLFTYIRK